MPDTKTDSPSKPLAERMTAPIASAAAETKVAVEPQPATSAGQPNLESTKAFPFTGAYFSGKVTRTISSPDPGNPGKMITARKTFDMITDLVIDRVSGLDFAARTDEKYITLNGQYAPSRTARITAFSQHSDAVIALVKGNVDTSNPERPLKRKITVNVIGTPMKGYGLDVSELYVKEPDGSQRTIIGPPAEVATQQADNELL
jgi:hypothetical protein